MKAVKIVMNDLLPNVFDKSCKKVSGSTADMFGMIAQASFI